MDIQRMFLQQGQVAGTPGGAVKPVKPDYEYDVYIICIYIYMYKYLGKT